MADSYLVYNKTDTQEPVKIRLVDNGDGTFSMAHALQGNQVRTILVEPPPLDFKTPKPKTPGQTFDVPHVMKRGSDVIFVLPNGAWTEESTGSYAAVSTQDGSSYNSSVTGAGQYRQTLFSFDILNALKIAGYTPQSWDIATFLTRLKSLTPSWVGYGSGANATALTNGATVKVWNRATSAWDAFGTNTASAPAAVTAAVAAVNFANYIDPTTGLIQLLAHSTYSSDGTIASTIFTDYISVAVQFYGDYANNGDALSQGRVGSAPPPFAQQIAGNKAGALTVPAVATAADGMSASLDGLVTTAVMMVSNGTTRDVYRAANKGPRVAFTSAASVNFPAPGSNKKINPFRINLVGITPGEKVDIKDGATVIRSKAADAQGNVEISWPDGGTAGRSAAANNVVSAAWTTAVTGSAMIIYNEE